MGEKDDAPSSDVVENRPMPLDYAGPGNKARHRGWWIGLLVGIAIVILLLLSMRVSPTTRSGNRMPPDSEDLRQIGQAILLYNHDYNGEYPATLGDLLAHEDMTPSEFVAPADDKNTPATGDDIDAILANFNAGGHCSFIYAGKGLVAKDVPADAVICYEPLSLHEGQGIYLLFGDGHVEFMSPNYARAIIAADASGVRPVRWPIPAATMPVVPQ